MNEVIDRIFGSAVGNKSGNIYPATTEDVKKCMKIWAEVQREIDAEDDMLAIEQRMHESFYFLVEEEDRDKCRVCGSTNLNEIGGTSKGIKFLCEECDHIMYKDKEGIMHD